MVTRIISFLSIVNIHEKDPLQDTMLWPLYIRESLYFVVSISVYASSWSQESLSGFLHQPWSHSSYRMTLSDTHPWTLKEKLWLGGKLWGPEIAVLLTEPREPVLIKTGLLRSVFPPVDWTPHSTPTSSCGAGCTFLVVCASCRLRTCHHSLGLRTRLHTCRRARVWPPLRPDMS